jgi:hypothetical protein
LSCGLDFCDACLSADSNCDKCRYENDQKAAENRIHVDFCIGKALFSDYYTLAEKMTLERSDDGLAVAKGVCCGLDTRVEFRRDLVLITTEKNPTGERVTDADGVSVVWQVANDVVPNYPGAQVIDQCPFLLALYLNVEGDPYNFRCHATVSSPDGKAPSTYFCTYNDGNEMWVNGRYLPAFPRQLFYAAVRWRQERPRRLMEHVKRQIQHLPGVGIEFCAARDRQLGTLAE